MPPHNRDRRRRPGKEKSRPIGPAAHRVVPCAKRVSDKNGELGHHRIGDHVDHLCAVLDDPLTLGLRANHEAGYVLKENNWDALLIHQFDEPGPLVSTIGVNDAPNLHFLLGVFETPPALHDLPLVSDDSDRPPVDTTGAADQGAAVRRLVLGEFGAIEDCRQQTAHVIGSRPINRKQAENVLGFHQRIPRFNAIEGSELRLGELADASANVLDCRQVVRESVVDHPRDVDLNHRPAQGLVVHSFADCRLYEVGSGEENGAVSLHYQGLVGHDRQVGATGDT